MMLDMKRTFDEVVPAHTDAAAGRGDLRQPVLPGDELDLRRHAGVHGDGEAGPAPGPRRVGPDRGGHPAVPLGAGLPGRAGRGCPGSSTAGCCGCCWPRPAAGGRSVFSLVTASFGLFSRAVQKILGAQLLTDLSGLRRGAGLDVRRLPASAPSRRTGSCRPRRRRSWWSRRRSRTRSGRPPTSPAGWRPSGCRWPAWCSTGCTAPAAAGLPARRPRSRRGRAGRSRADHAGRPPTRCGCTPALVRSGPQREHGWPARFTDAHPGRAGGRGRGAARRRPRRRRAADDRRAVLAAGRSG